MNSTGEKNVNTYRDKWISDDFTPGLVSVIIPTFNRAGFITEAMDSVLAQTYRPIQLIIADDGSTDNTRETVEEWKQMHSEKNFEINYFFQKQKGPSAARNLGMVKAKGEYIQFLDSDDKLHPHKLKVHVASLIRNPRCNYVVSKMKNTTNVNEFVKPMPATKEISLRLPYDFHKVEWYADTGLYRRAICATMGPWNEKMSMGGDFEYAFRLACFYEEIKFIPGVYVLVRCGHAGRISDMSRISKKDWAAKYFFAVKETERYLDKIESKDVNLHSIVAYQFYAIARDAVSKGFMDIAKNALSRAAKHRARLSVYIKISLLKYLYAHFGNRFTIAVFNFFSVVKSKLFLGIKWLTYR